MTPPSDLEVAAGLAAAGLTVSADEARRLARFLGLLEQWNRVHNLTAIHAPGELIERHLAESLALEPCLSGSDVADIGSGGGLPGIPLAIRLPATRFTLIESRRKRVSFLRHVAVTLGLANISVAHGRAEALELPGFSSVLARAVAPPAELLAIATPLVKPGGRLVLLTSTSRGAEIERLARGFRPLAPPPGGRAPGKSRIVVLERELS
jgi:16S rRNA (guanine527-N7)-methyltransferase